MNPLTLEWRQTLILIRRLGGRTLRHRASLVLALGLIVSAGISASLGFFARNFQDTLDRDFAEFLGAPLVVRSSVPLPIDWWAEQVASNNSGASEGPIASETLTTLSSAQTAAFTTGAIGPGGYQSIALKGVRGSYPLQGSLQLKGYSSELDKTDVNETPTEGVGRQPQTGTAWLDARAMRLLGAQQGDQIQIGPNDFRVTAELVFEPDRLTQMQHILPRVMISMADLNALGLNQHSGRGEFRYLFGGNQQALIELEQTLPERLSEGYEVLKPSKGQHPFSRMSERIGRFLGLVSVLVLVLCGSASAILANHIAREYVGAAAVLRCLGAERRVVSRVLWLQLVAISVVSGLAGGAIGWWIQPLLFSLLEPHLMLSATEFDMAPVGVALAVVLLMTLSFVWPRLSALNTVPAWIAMRGGATKPPSYLGSFLLASCSCGLLLWLYTDNPKLTGILAVGVLGMIGVATLTGWALSKLASQLHHLSHGRLRVILRAIGRSPGRHTATMATVSLAVMAFLVTAAFRGGFLDTYHQSRLERDGNYVFSDLSANQVDAFERTILTQEARSAGYYPTVRAHLVSINAVAVDQVLKNESDSREELRSAVRLSWAEGMPQNTRLVEGDWPQEGQRELSVDSEVISDLGLNIGDELGFIANGKQITARISGTHGFKSGGSSVAFWFMFAPGVLDSFEQRYMGGIQIDANHDSVLAVISARFPSVKITSLEQHLARIRSIMQAITQGFDSLALMMVCAALVVIFAVSLESRNARSRQEALLHTLGVTLMGLRKMRWVEQIGLGLLAGLVALGGANLIMELVFRFQFALPYRFDGWLYLAVPLGSALSLVLVGMVFDAPRKLRSNRLLEQT